MAALMAAVPTSRGSVRPAMTAFYMHNQQLIPIHYKGNMITYNMTFFIFMTIGVEP